MTALEAVRSMNEEQARKTLQAMRAVRADGVEGATAVMETMTSKELDTFIAFLEAAAVENSDNTHDA